MSSDTQKLDEYFKQTPMPNDINESSVELIRNWIRAQHHLPRITDRQISVFIHSCMGALEMTKSTIEYYYTIRSNSPEIFEGRKAELFSETEKVVCFFKLPELSVNKYEMFYGALNDMDSEKLRVPEAASLIFSLVDIYSNLQPYVDGWIVLLNAKGFAFGHFVKLTTSLGVIKKAISYVQDAMPIRLKEIHIFNANPLVCQFIGIIKPFMKKELYDMIHIFSTSETEKLNEFVSPDTLPNDCGGKGGTVDELIKVSNEMFAKYNAWYDDDEKLARTDETKRSTKLMERSESFGVDGSFKKLSID